MELTDYVKEQIEEKIELKKKEWADNYIARAFQSELDTPEAKLQVEAATKNMELHEQTIKWLENFLKKQ